MAKNLSTYSIETDTTVLLQFSDGSSSHAELNNLGSVLSSEDQTKVHEGLRLRHRFIKRNLGSLARFLVIGLAVLVIGYGSAKAAQAVYHHYDPAAAPVSATPAGAQTSIQATGSIQGATSAPASNAVTAATPSSTNPQASTSTVSPTTSTTSLGQSVQSAAPVALQAVTSVATQVQGLTSSLGIGQSIPLP